MLASATLPMVFTKSRGRLALDTFTAPLKWAEKGPWKSIRDMLKINSPFTRRLANLTHMNNCNRTSIAIVLAIAALQQPVATQAQTRQMPHFS